MNCYLIDTNILLLYLRQDRHWENIQKIYKLDKTTNYISVVSLGELYSLALRNDWGIAKIKRLNLLSQELVVADIHVMSIIQCYGEIDAFSQNKLKDKPLSDSARNMGKNDLWIAATAAVLQIPLLTTDKDFNHLNQIYLDVAFVDISIKKIHDDNEETGCTELRIGKIYFPNPQLDVPMFHVERFNRVQAEIQENCLVGRVLNSRER